MNASQFLAWIICLALAFFAGILAARNTAKTAMLERQFDRVVLAAAGEQTALLRDVGAVLKQIESGLQPAAGAAALERLSGQVRELRDRLDAIEGRPAAPTP